MAKYKHSRKNKGRNPKLKRFPKNGQRFIIESNIKKSR